MILDLRSYVVQVENFSLVENEVQLDQVQHGQTSCLLLSLYKCCQVANAPYERFICSICSKTQIIPALNNDTKQG